MKYVNLLFYFLNLKNLLIPFLVNLCQDDEDDSWKPLLLIIPLRLGLSEINPIYIEGLKKCFEISGTVGMVGGRPNRALYFIGYVGDEALYLGMTFSNFIDNFHYNNRNGH